MDPKALGQFLMQPSTADVLNTPVRRGGILPVTEYPNRTEFDLSSGLTGALWNALTAPARAARGEISEDQQIPEAFNFAGSLTLGSLLAPRPGGSVGMGGRAAKGALDMSEAARMARAKEMGFDTENVLYHGSPYANLIKEFDMASPSRTDSGWLGTAAYMSPKEFIAKAYATPMNGKSSSYPDRGVLSLYAKKGKYKDFEYLDTETYQGQIKEFAKSLGVDGEFGTKQWSDAFRQAMIDNGYVGSRGLNADGSIVETAIYDPTNIRSVNAAFDPEKAHLANLLAANAKTGAAVPLATRALEAQQPQGIRAFHGSPHDFDRFSMDAIGTGEGAQAYGHGLYFAESEGVAKSYREMLSGKSYKINGTGKDASGVYGDDVLEIFDSYGGDAGELADALAGMRAKVKQRLDEEGLRDVSQLKPKTNNPTLDLDAQTILLADRADRLEQLMKGPGVKLDDGHMYEVNIKADPQDFLDWDKPLRDQMHIVEKHPILKEFYDKQLPYVERGQTMRDGKLHAEGRHAVADINRRIGKENVGQHLSEAGIPGIRYLDQMSRGAGEGSSNYVVFDDSLIEILRKYGLLGPVAGGGTLAGMLMGGQGGDTY